jgi:hypothetical protein
VINGNRCLQRLGFHVFDDLCVNFPVAFEDAENDMLAFGPATALAAFMARAEVRFINFDLAGKRRFLFTEIGDQGTS